MPNLNSAQIKLLETAVTDIENTICEPAKRRASIAVLERISANYDLSQELSYKTLSCLVRIDLRANTINILNILSNLINHNYPISKLLEKFSVVIFLRDCLGQTLAVARQAAQLLEQVLSSTSENIKHDLVQKIYLANYLITAAASGDIGLMRHALGAIIHLSRVNEGLATQHVSILLIKLLKETDEKQQALAAKTIAELALNDEKYVYLFLASDLFMALGRLLADEPVSTRSVTACTALANLARQPERYRQQIFRLKQIGKLPLILRQNNSDTAYIAALNLLANLSYNSVERSEQIDRWYRRRILELLFKENVRQHAAYALGNIAAGSTPKACAQLLADAQDTLIDMLYNGSIDEKNAAAYALACLLGNTEDICTLTFLSQMSGQIEALLKALLINEATQQQALHLTACILANSPLQFSDELRPLFEDLLTRSDCQAYALCALIFICPRPQEYHSPDLYAVLIQLMQSNDSDRRLAINALERLGRPQDMAAAIAIADIHLRYAKRHPGRTERNKVMVHLQQFIQELLPTLGQTNSQTNLILTRIREFQDLDRASDIIFKKMTEAGQDQQLIKRIEQRTINLSFQNFMDKLDADRSEVSIPQPTLTYRALQKRLAGQIRDLDSSLAFPPEGVAYKEMEFARENFERTTNALAHDIKCRHTAEECHHGVTTATSSRQQKPSLRRRASSFIMSRRSN